MIGRRGARLEELEALYRGRFEVFARVAASVTGDSERALDAVQDAFATAVRRRRSFRRWRKRILNGGENSRRLTVACELPALETYTT